MTGKIGLLDEAFDHLTLGSAAIYEAVLQGFSLNPCRAPLQLAVGGLRRAGHLEFLALGLLTRASLRSIIGARIGPESAQADLDEAWEIAERGPMPLFLANIHLHRARLFHAVIPYPWPTDSAGNLSGPKDDLAAARHLIEKHGYWRRKEELEDAEAAAKTW